MGPKARNELLELLREDREAIEAEAKRRYATIRWGQVSALIISLVFLGCATMLILLGHETAGTVIAGIDIVSLVAAFLGVNVKTR
jgi:hypothetical protein